MQSQVDLQNQCYSKRIKIMLGALLVSLLLLAFYVKKVDQLQYTVCGV